MIQVISKLLLTFVGYMLYIDNPDNRLTNPNILTRETKGKISKEPEWKVNISMTSLALHPISYQN